MPLNRIKDYNFLPSFKAGEVANCRLPSKSALFSRLSIGQLFFRSIDRGQAANHIGLKLEEITSETDPTLLRLTVTSPLITTTSFVGQGNGKIGGIVVINQPPLKEYSFIAVSPTQFNSALGLATVNVPFKCDYLAMMISSGQTPFQVGDVFKIKIAGGTEIHETLATPTTSTSTTDINGITTTSEDPNPSVPALRIVVNQNSKVVRMPLRGTDRTDIGNSDKGYTLFPETYMIGGDGLPLNAVGIKTGPDRAMVFVNYSENEGGQMSTIAKVFEWVGDDAYNGTWKIYS